jgi:hypothetical protein
LAAGEKAVVAPATTRVSLLEKTIEKSKKAEFAWAKALIVYKRDQDNPPYWRKSNWKRELEAAQNEQRIGHLIR